MSRFSIIYADPPWSYQGQKQHNGVEGNKSVTDHYNVVDLEKLKTLNVASVCESDCLLFMWTSSPHLDQAIDLMRAWGFQYKTVAFVWYKQKTNPGYYTMSECEICIVGKRGCIPQPRGTRNERQFLSEKRGAHSAKPAAIRERISRMFPTQKKLELFCREKIAGWSSWGNEVESDVTLNFLGGGGGGPPPGNSVPN